MADQVVISRQVSEAAGTATTVNFAPTNSTEKWILKELCYNPQEAIATNGTDYVTFTPTVNSTAVAAARNTSSTGFTATTPESQTLTGTGKTLEISQATPLLVTVAQAGAGKKIRMGIDIKVEVIRV